MKIAGAKARSNNGMLMWLVWVVFPVFVAAFNFHSDIGLGFADKFYVADLHRFVNSFTHVVNGEQRC